MILTFIVAYWFSKNLQKFESNLATWVFICALCSFLENHLDVCSCGLQHGHLHLHYIILQNLISHISKFNPFVIFTLVLAKAVRNLNFKFFWHGTLLFSPYQQHTFKLRSAFKFNLYFNRELCKKSFCLPNRLLGQALI